LDGLPQNWAELRDYARQCTDADHDIYGFTLFMNEQPPANGSIVITYPLIYAAGGRTIVDGKPSVEDPAVLKAVQLLKDLTDDGSVIPGTTSKLEVQMVEEFSAGNICMMIENTGHVGTLANRNPDLDYGVIPIPPYDSETTPALRSHGWELAMSATSKHKQEAWTFMNWLVSAGPDSKLAQLSSNIPGNMAADVSFFKDSPQLTASIDYIAHGTLVEELMVTPQATAHWTAFTTETIKMLLGEQSPEDVIKNTQQAWDDLDG
jgi:ABC-type glycerol-3-phosphate transport system substrate-binding protein